jgi:hypothetical protein
MAARRMMWQVKDQPQKKIQPTTYGDDNDILVTKEQFLAVLARLQDNAENDEEPVTPVATSATITMSPPPGLSLPPPIPELPDLESLEVPVVAELPAPPKQGYQVLLRDLSETIAQEPMMRVMLEQAGLEKDFIRLDFRPGGKALIEFHTFASMQQCISHFHHRPWGEGGACISALYVRIVKKADAPAGEKGAARAPAARMTTSAATMMKSLSVHAPVFLPNASRAAAARVFVPSLPEIPEKIDAIRPRVSSDASTAAGGPASDEVASENCGDDGSDDEAESLYDGAVGPPNAPVIT